MDPVEVIEYKGINIEVIPDENTESPDEWGDDGIFLVGFHREFTVKRDGFGQDVVGELLESRKKSYGKYWVFGLEAYIHSGVALALASEGNFPDRQWDVSLLGMVFVSKKHWKTRAEAKKGAEGLIESWNDYLGGNVYGFDIPEIGESVWGFYGDYNESGGLVDEAKGMIDSYLEHKRQEKIKKTKALIKNKVGLSYR